MAAVAVGGQQHGMVCLDDDGEVVRPALLWNDTRSAQAAADLVTELGDGDGRRPCLGRCRRRGPGGVLHRRPSCAGWPTTNPTTRGPRPPCCLPHDWLTWRLAGGGELGCADDRPERRLRHRLLVRGQRRVPAPSCCERALGAVPAGPAGARSRRDGGRNPDRGRPRARRRRQRGRCARARGRAGRRGAVDRHVRGGDRRGRPPQPRPDGNVAGLRRRHRTVPPAGGDPERRAGPRRGGAAPGRRPRTDSPTSPCRPSPVRAGSCWCRTSRASAPRTCPTRPARCEGLTLATATPAHVARAAVEGLLCGLADGLDALVATGVRPHRILLGRRRCRLGGGTPDRAVGPRPARSTYPAGGVRRRRRLPPGRLGRSPAADEPPAWATSPTTRYDAPARPDIRARYADEAARVAAGQRAPAHRTLSKLICESMQLGCVIRVTSLR